MKLGSESGSRHVRGALAYLLAAPRTGLGTSSQRFPRVVSQIPYALLRLSETRSQGTRLKAGSDNRVKYM